MDYLKKVRDKLQHYNHEKYWSLRAKIVGNTKYPMWLKAIWLYIIKRSDAFNNASMGTYIGHGADFLTPPILPHGLYGIIVSQNAVIGQNCVIYHQVTIGEGTGGAPIIGDNCYICAGAKITGKVKIGNNVIIGTNCVVVEDVQDNSTVVMCKPRVIIRK